MGGCAYSTGDHKDELIRQFIQRLPLVQLNLIDYEDYVKRLVCPEDNDEMTLLQLSESFRSSPAFEQLQRQGSFFRSMLTSRFFWKDIKEQREPFPEDDARLSVTILLLFGILYCKASPTIKANLFFDIVQPDLLGSLDPNSQGLRHIYERTAALAFTFPKYFSEAEE